MNEQPIKSTEKPIREGIEALKRDISEATKQKEWFKGEMENVQREIEEMKNEPNIPEDIRMKLITALEEDMGMLSRGLIGSEKLLDILGETWGIMLKTERYEEDVVGGSDSTSTIN